MLQIAGESLKSTESRSAAIIEIGSRGVRLLVARRCGSELEEIHRAWNSSARLGDILEAGDAAVQSQVSEVRRVIDDYLIRCRSLALDHGRVWVVGTESVRRLRKTSKTSFQQLSSGLPQFRVITERDEAFYSLVTAIHSPPSVIGTATKILIVDAGAGSIDLAVGRASEETRLVSHRSHALGTTVLVSQLRRLHGNFSKLDHWLALRLAGPPLRGALSAECTVMLGSAITKFASLHVRRDPTEPYNPRKVHGLRMKSKALDSFIRRAIACPENVRRLIDPRNGKSSEFEAVVSGLVATTQLLRQLGKEEFIVCAQGLRYGLAWQAVSGALSLSST